MRRFPLTWTAIVVLTACGIFGWRRPREFGSPSLTVTTVYGPSQRIRVVAYAPDLDPAVSRPKLRAWLRAHLVPYEG